MRNHTKTVTILGIESSCDETAAAIVDVRRKTIDDRRKIVSFTFDVRSSVVSSQVRIHAKYGGVVPEVAAREHVTHITLVIREACARAGFNDHRAAHVAIDAIAVTAGPGLITSLTVGVETARAIAFAWEKPLVAVNHIDGHIISALLEQRRDELESWKAGKLESPHACLQFPALALVVSGGHTEILLMRDWATYERVGGTRDDAAGEAFDKVAKLLDLGYPGGPIIAKRAETGNPTAFNFPRPMLRARENFSAKGKPASGWDFSFSGLKTAVRYFVENAECKMQNAKFIADVCASFQQAVVDVLVAKTIAAAKKYETKTVLLGGGVAANHALREQLGAALASHLPSIVYRLPSPPYTGDNAAMIAAAGGVRFLRGERTAWDALDAQANWELGV